jgi:hypothetical protein
MIFCCTQTHTWYLEVIFFFFNDEETRALKKGETHQLADPPLEAFGLVTSTIKSPSSPQDEKAFTSQVTSP